jgi:hypothetical protein
MGVFVCDNCDCVENTALGHFWSKDRLQLKGFPLGTALCSECSPSEWANGERHGDDLAPPGKWHGKFPKVQWDGKREVMNRPNKAVANGKPKKEYPKKENPPRITRRERRKMELEARKVIITFDGINRNNDI